MREIKFRGQNTKTHNWVYGDLIHNENRAYIHTNNHAVPEVFPKTVGQYAGQKDKNGREIFEGDIVYIENEGNNFKVVWDRELVRFILESNDLIVDFDNYYGEDLEVVSNKHKKAKIVKKK